MVRKVLEVGDGLLNDVANPVDLLIELFSLSRRSPHPCPVMATVPAVIASVFMILSVPETGLKWW
jgi:hypothetical protein